LYINAGDVTVITREKELLKHPREIPRSGVGPPYRRVTSIITDAHDERIEALAGREGPYGLL
jgi:hypothetical protein